MKKRGSRDGLSLRFEEPVPQHRLRRIVEHRVGENPARTALRAAKR